MKKRSSEFHAGARYERQAILAFLNREIRKNGKYNWVANGFFDEIKQWILKRKERYRKLEGGL